MMSKIIEKIEKEDKKLSTLAKISRWHGDLEHFFDFILDYFELDKVLDDKYNEKFDYPHEHLYYKQEHKSLNYIEYFLREIKPFLLLAYRLSRIHDLPNKLEENNINEDSIVNMIDNFTNLYRTGRPRKFSPEGQEEFQKFKKKYQNIIGFLQEIKFDKVQSRLDFANTIMKYQISEEQLNNYKFEFNYWKKCYKGWSRATIYRFDKDLMFLGKNYFWVKDTLRKYDFYQTILKLEKSGKELEARVENLNLEFEKL